MYFAHAIRVNQFYTDFAQRGLAHIFHRKNVYNLFKDYYFSKIYINFD